MRTASVLAVASAMFVSGASACSGSSVPGGGAAGDDAGESAATAGDAGLGGVSTLSPPLGDGAASVGPTGGNGGQGGGDGAAGAASAADAGGPQVGKLFWLAIAGNEVIEAAEDGAGAHALASANGISAPDGVAVDVAGGKIYWTNMGTLTDGPHTPAGSLQRANLDGSNVEVLLKPGVTTNTPKQCQLDLVHQKIYWSDREGAKAWRANLDGSDAEILLTDHGIMQLVGMALDIPKSQFYVTDRYAKFILRAGFDMPAGQTAANRSDVEQLVTEQGSAMPIDLDLDLQHRTMYWTDRSLNTIQRAGMDLPSGQTAANRTDLVTLVSGLSTPIGISLDLASNAASPTLYFTELGGQVFRANLDGTGKTSIGSSSGASGITHVEVPAP